MLYFATDTLARFILFLEWNIFFFNICKNFLYIRTQSIAACVNFEIFLVITRHPGKNDL